MVYSRGYLVVTVYPYPPGDRIPYTLRILSVSDGHTNRLEVFE